MLRGSQRPMTICLVALLVIWIGASGCIHFMPIPPFFVLASGDKPYPDPKAGEEQAYLASVRRSPLVFTLRGPDASAAREREDSFLADQGMGGFTYLVLKEPEGDGTRYYVKCSANEYTADDLAVHNAHILAYYIRTGELQEKFVAKGRRP